MNSQDKAERDLILRTLLLARGEWVRASQIADLSLIWFSHIEALREIGFSIQERRRVAQADFRLLQNPMKQNTPLFPEFGDIWTERRYPD